MNWQLSLPAVIAVVGVAASDGASRGLVIQINEPQQSNIRSDPHDIFPALPGPELDSLWRALAVGHHHVLEEDGLVAVSPGDAGVVTCREGRLGVLAGRHSEMVARSEDK